MSIMEELGINAPVKAEPSTRAQREARRQAQRSRWAGPGRVDVKTCDGVEVKATETEVDSKTMSDEEKAEYRAKNMPLKDLQKEMRKTFKHPDLVTHVGQRRHRNV
jgi:hypothetical protein